MLTLRAKYDRKLVGQTPGESLLPKESVVILYVYEYTLYIYIYIVYIYIIILSLSIYIYHRYIYIYVYIYIAWFETIPTMPGLKLFPRP